MHVRRFQLRGMVLTNLGSFSSERIGAGHADAAIEDGCDPDAAAAAAQHRAVMAGAIFQVRILRGDPRLANRANVDWSPSLANRCH